jgi:hypothetical protein
VHGRQAFRAGASQQPQQKRFGLVIACVTDSDAIRAEVRQGTAEKLVARRTGRVFERSPVFLRTGADVFPLDEDRTVAGRRKLNAERLVTGRFIPQLMIEVREPGDDELARRLDLAQQVHERHGVGSARQRDDDTRLRAGQIMLADSAPEGIDHLHRRESTFALTRYGGQPSVACQPKPSFARG